MTIEKKMAAVVADSGMTITFVSAKTGISYGKLYASLKGKRELRADEFLSLCQLFRLDPCEAGMMEVTA